MERGLLMAKKKSTFKCKLCGATEYKWIGRCPSCNEWDTFEETVEVNTRTTVASSMVSKKPERLNAVVGGSEFRLKTLYPEFDRALGGGVVTDSVNLLSAQPGGGKTTMLSQISADLANRGYVGIYVSGEESKTQIKKRMDRVHGDTTDTLYILTESSINILESWVEVVNPDFIVFDSIQTAYVEELPNSPGSPTQVKESTARLIAIAKKREKKCIIFAISQINKKEEVLGQQALSHMVDATLFMESENYEQLKVLKTTKNRFGEQEIALFTMDEKGMHEISDPSVFFATQREEAVAGTSLSVTRNASRNIVIEIESLVSTSYYGFPSRKGVGVRKEIVDIVTEILEQKGNMNFENKNVTVMTTRGLRVTETAINLAVATSIISGYYNVPLEDKTAYIGELGLTGEIKGVIGVESRIRELDRLGYKKVYVGKGQTFDKSKITQIKIVEVSRINEIISSIKKSAKPVEKKEKVYV